MTPSPDIHEEHLSRRFRQLREVESQTAPPLPALSAVTARRQQRNTFGVRAAAAVAVSLAASVMVMVVLPARQSPETLYLDIMRSSVLITEDLLQAGSTLPEHYRMPTDEFAPVPDLMSEPN